MTSFAVAERASAIVTEGIWFGDQDRPGLGWLSQPTDRATAGGVVIAPPLGYPYWSSHRTLRVLAERLARAGYAVLRIDYDGTGDSAGDQWDPGRLAAWRRSVALAVAVLRGRGAHAVTLIGARLGATIMLLDGSELGADGVVAWSPVSIGRRYAKELRLLSHPVPEQPDQPNHAGTRVAAGNVFSVETLTDLDRLDLTDLTEPPAPRTLVIDDRSGSAHPAVEHLRSLGAVVDHVRLDGGERALETPPEFATVPEEIVDAACDWIGAAPGVAARRDATPTHADARTRLLWRGQVITEEVITLAPGRHVGIRTAPEAPDPDRTTLVLLNPGSESHIGPGRAWVELARDLALNGRQTVRVDFLGWGESPDDGRAPGRPYDPRCVEDSAQIVAELRAAGHRRIAICGLCASAWIALAAVTRTFIEGVIAINPQLYWRQGDPVEINWDLIRARRAREIRRIERGARIRVWDALDMLGHRPPAGSWLDALAGTGASIHLVFADNDDGLIYLNRRLRRRVREISRRGAIALRVMPEVDHPMHLTWLRPRVVTALAEALLEIDRAGPRPGVAAAGSRQLA